MGNETIVAFVNQVRAKLNTVITRTNTLPAATKHVVYNAVIGETYTIPDNCLGVRAWAIGQGGTGLASYGGGSGGVVPINPSYLDPGAVLSWQLGTPTVKSQYTAMGTPVGTVCSSSSGQYVYYFNGGYVYYSSNYGASFTSLYLGGSFSPNPNTNSARAECSPDGKYISVPVNDKILRSSDFGVTWTMGTSGFPGGTAIYQVSRSSNMQHQIILSTNNLTQFAFSHDYGATFIPFSVPSGTIPTVANISITSAVSEDGQTMALLYTDAGTYKVYYTRNGGSTWTSSFGPFGAVTAGGNYLSMSPDGLKFVFISNGDRVYITKDITVGWTGLSGTTGLTNYAGFKNVAWSADSQRMVAFYGNTNPSVNIISSTDGLVTIKQANYGSVVGSSYVQTTVNSVSYTADLSAVYFLTAANKLYKFASNSLTDVTPSGAVTLANISVSADGSVVCLITSSPNTNLYISGDQGVTWYSTSVTSGSYSNTVAQLTSWTNLKGAGSPGTFSIVLSGYTPYFFYYLNKICGVDVISLRGTDAVGTTIGQGNPNGGATGCSSSSGAYPEVSIEGICRGGNGGAPTRVPRMGDGGSGANAGGPAGIRIEYDLKVA